MWPFNNTKTTYIDTLQDWRGIKVGDFNMLDKVLVTRTVEIKGFRTYRVDLDIKNQGEIECIIIGDRLSAEYAKHDGIVILPGYLVLTKEGEILCAHLVRKSYGELQEEFDHLLLVEEKKQELIANEEKFKQSLEDLQSLIDKGKDIQSKNIDYATSRLLGN